MNLFEEFLSQLGVYTNHPEDILHTVDHSEFIIVDGEEGDYGLVKYWDENDLLAIRKVSGGDIEETFFTKMGKSKLSELAKKWLNITIEKIYHSDNLLDD